jgi:hypothetical protein
MPWPDAATHSIRGDLAGTDLNALEVNVGGHGTVMDPSYWALGGRSSVRSEQRIHGYDH